MKPGTELAPEGMVYVCRACGKTSRTRYGFDDNQVNTAVHGWDASCTLNCELFNEKDLVYAPTGRVAEIKASKTDSDNESAAAAAVCASSAVVV